MQALESDEKRADIASQLSLSQMKRKKKTMYQVSMAGLPVLNTRAYCASLQLSSVSELKTNALYDKPGGSYAEKKYDCVILLLFPIGMCERSPVL